MTRAVSRRGSKYVTDIIKDFSVTAIYLPKRQGSLGNVGIMRFVFTNFQADNYGTSSGDDEGNCMYNFLFGINYSGCQS